MTRSRKRVRGDFLSSFMPRVAPRLGSSEHEKDRGPQEARINQHSRFRTDRNPQEREGGKKHLFRGACIEEKSLHESERGP